jgi:23S rRNA (adenine2503-C2)-methyltransferase
MAKTNLKDMSKGELESFVHKSGLPSYRTGQLIHWIYEKYVRSIDEITEFSKDLHKRLSEKAYISNLKPLKRESSNDGTEKYLFHLEDGETIESVLIPDADRITLCISSQAGCAMGCKFCLTGEIGLKRNLKAYEIVDQIISVTKVLSLESIVMSPREKRVTNIVFMGMGEPLENFDEVVEALWRMTEFMGISKRRITLSTAGIVPKILEIAGRSPHVNLAISLNATTDEVRNRLMPLNKKYPIKSLLDACRRFPLESRRKITFEYVMLDGINDTMDDAGRLIRLLKGIRCKINLIPFNPYEESKFKRPSDEKVLKFQNILFAGNITALIRKSKGEDILASCGQLKAEYI